jgi:outer membrane lipoprotein-sorting protein
MEIVSNHYSGIRDFEATITIRQGTVESQGRLSYLQPSFLRIDYTRPAEQLIVFDGDALNIYVPDMRAVLNQNLNRRAGATGTALGLSLLRRNYVPSFFSSPHPEPLEPGSGERVIKLRLTRRTAAEGFTEIILSINPDTRIIRRMEGRTIGNSEIRFDFTNVRVNQGIPEQRFVFDPPAGANLYQNFLFRVD